MLKDVNEEHSVRIQNSRNEASYVTLIDSRDVVSACATSSLCRKASQPLLYRLT